MIVRFLDVELVEKRRDYLPSCLSARCLPAFYFTSNNVRVSSSSTRAHDNGTGLATEFGGQCDRDRVTRPRSVGQFCFVRVAVISWSRAVGPAVGGGSDLPRTPGPGGRGGFVARKGRGNMAANAKMGKRDTETLRRQPPSVPPRALVCSSICTLLVHTITLLDPSSPYVSIPLALIPLSLWPNSHPTPLTVLRWRPRTLRRSTMNTFAHDIYVHFGNPLRRSRIAQAIVLDLQ